jgi:integrase
VEPVLLKSGLPHYFTPKSLRHSYGSRLIARGISPALVQEWMGHASVELTVGTYGSWLPKTTPREIDVLDVDVAEEADDAAEQGRSTT